jgi:hypothetical protein
MQEVVGEADRDPDPTPDFPQALWHEARYLLYWRPPQVIQRCLIVKGIAGLGNRIATLCSAIEYARRNGRILFVDWSDPTVSDRRKNLFPEYFRMEGVGCVADPAKIAKGSVYPSPYAPDPLAAHNDLYWNFRYRSASLFDRVSRGLPNGRLRMLQGYWHLLPAKEGGAATFTAFLRGIADRRNFPMGHHLPDDLGEEVVVYADYIPPFSDATLRAHVRLQPEMEERVDRLARDLALDGCVGVHVRMSDKKPGSADPASDVARAMKRSGLSGRPVFLATDNPDVERRFRATFGDVRAVPKAGAHPSGEPPHVWAERRGDRGLSRTLLEEGIVDMWLLSRCAGLLYQGNSAFTLPSRALHAEPAKQIDWDR